MDDEAAQDARPSQERPRWSPVVPLLANHILLGDKNAAKCFTTSEMAIVGSSSVSYGRADGTGTEVTARNRERTKIGHPTGHLPDLRDQPDGRDGVKLDDRWFDEPAIGFGKLQSIELTQLVDA